MPTLAEALSLEENGQNHRSGQFLKKLYQENESDFETCYHYGRFLLENGYPAEALDVLRQAKEQEQHSPYVWYQLGKAYEQTGRPDGAENCYYNAAELARGGLEVGESLRIYREYLMFYLRQARIADLTKYLEGLRKIEGSENDVLEFEAILDFFDTEFLSASQKAEEVFVKNHVRHRAVLPYWLLGLFYAGEVGALRQAAITLRTFKDLPPLATACAQVLMEVLFCLNGAENRLDRMGEIDISNNGRFVEEDQTIRMLMRMVVGYYHTLKAVYEERVQRGVQLADESLPTIYMVGDSHIISPSYRCVSLQKEFYRLEPRLAMGIKAWHVACGHICRPLTALKWQLGRLPKGANVLLSIGEIDCRVDEGLLPYLQKNPDVSMEAYVAEVVSDYMEELNVLTKDKSFGNVYLSNVPAPRFVDVHKNLCQQLSEIIKIFNKNLKEKAEVYGYKVVDIHAETVDVAEHFAAEGQHIDSVHLSGDVLIRALEK